MTEKQYEFHEVCETFPLLDGQEFDDLVEDIRKHGLKVPPVLHEGKILDGRNRIRAAEKAGIAVTQFDTPTDIGDPLDYVLSMNAHRRHLNTEQKRDLINKLLKAKPERSDRSIGKDAKVDHKTVGKARKDGETSGEIPQTDERVDTKGTKRPAKPPVTAKPPIVPKLPKPKKPAGEQRDKAISSFAALLHNNEGSALYRHLEDLHRLLADERKRIGELAMLQRVSLGRGFLTALGLSLDDLKPIGGAQ
jgi:hypothetical protein